MQKKKNREIKLIFAVLSVIFLVFLAIPEVKLLLKSFQQNGNTGFTLLNYREVLTSKGFLQAVGNSFLVASVSAVITTILAFFWRTPCIIQTHRKYSRMSSVKQQCFRCCCRQSLTDLQLFILSGSRGF